MGKERCTVHQVLEMRESKDVSVKLQGGVGLATLDPFYVFLHPEFPNVFGTAWDFDVLGHYGFDTKGFSSNVPFLGDCAGQSCYERSVRGRLARPRIFATPLTLEINGQYQYRVTPDAAQPVRIADRGHDLAEVEATYAHWNARFDETGRLVPDLVTA